MTLSHTNSLEPIRFVGRHLLEGRLSVEGGQESQIL